MIQVIEGKIKQYSLPTTGKLKDGRTVSGYNLLDEETLREEGWLPLEDIKPEHDENTQYIVDDGYEVLEDKVIKKYKIENMPEPEIVDEPMDEEKVAIAEAIIDLEGRISVLEGGK